MNEFRRYHILIEQQVDLFISLCSKIVKDRNIDKTVWVSKEEESSMVCAGNPDKVYYSKDFGFTIPYEAIMKDISEAIELFVFKLDHFIKLAQSTNKFSAFKNDKTHKSTDSENKKL